MNNLNVNEVLSAFGKASEAYSKLPELEAEIRAKDSTIHHNETTIGTQLETIRTLEAKQGELEAMIRTLKEERDEARFHGLELEEDLGKLRSLVKSVVDIAAPAVAPAPDTKLVVDPVPEMKTEEGPAVLEAKPEPAPTEDKPWWIKNPEPAQPSDGYRPGDMSNKLWWERPSYMSEERFVELGGQKYPY